MRPVRGVLKRASKTCQRPPRKDFHVGVEIHRRAGILAADVGYVTADVAGGNVKRAAERDRAVRQVAADSVTAFDDVMSRDARAAGAGAVFDIAVDPVANGADAGETVWNFSEVIPREVEQLVGVAVARGERVAQEGSREEMRGDRLVEMGEVLALAGHHHDGVEAQEIRAGLEPRGDKDVAVVVLELGGQELGMKFHAFLANGLVGVVARLEGDERGHFAGAFVGELASGAHGEIERWHWHGGGGMAMVFPHGSGLPINRSRSSF